MQKDSLFRKAARPFTRKGWGHWVRFLLLLAVAGLGGHVLSKARWLIPLRYRIYHWQLRMRDRSQLYPQRTALVLLKDDDYWGNAFQSRTPLKREPLAEIVDELNAAGVNTVALDIDLRSPRPQQPEFEFEDYRAEDQKLFAAIERMCKAGRHVVLASSVEFGSDGYAEMPSIYASSLKEMPCVETGYIQVPFDLRQIPGSLELANGGSVASFSLEVTGIADPTARARAAANPDKGFRYSEYLTPDDFNPRDGRQFAFSGADLKNIDANTLRNQLADKLVFVGANWHSNAYGSGPLVDMHNSPGGLEPGVMLHANYVEAMLDRTGTFAPVSDSIAEVIEIALALSLAVIGVLEIHTAWKWAAFGIGIVFSILFTYTLLQNLGLFLDFFVPLLMIIFHTLVEEGMKMMHELQHLKQKANA